MSTTIPAGFTEGAPTSPGNYAVLGLDDVCLWGQWDGAKLRSHGWCHRSAYQIAAHFPLPPDPPALPRRFRCVRKKDKAAFSGVNFADPLVVTVHIPKYGCQQYYSQHQFDDEFTITEWVDP